MQKHNVEITIQAQVFGDAESDVSDTVANAFDGPIPGLINAEVTSLTIK